ncbi:MAG: hypothetical protein H6617_03900 [Bdellovibrionaceae bacterium]|nr:hypothetical protein [Bdellovibrionales bacterium]MCB9253802.1 hypothetical protein [Pseudobdellovibrionaceae bacterium]
MLWVGFTLLLASGMAHASETLDELYANRSIIPLVTNWEAYPVYADYVEKALAERLESDPRFESSEQSRHIGRSELKKLGVTRLSESEVVVSDKKQGSSDEQKLELELAPIRPLLGVLVEMGVHSVLFGEINLAPETFRLDLYLVNARTAEVMAVARQKVEDRFSLDSFSAASNAAFDTLLRKLPFDGTVVKREGYRVVLNVGEPLKNGDVVPTYTLEKRGGEMRLEETGSVELLQVEQSISFGKILVEKKPREITQGNKIRIPLLHPVAEATEGMIEDASREVASESLEVGPQRSLGYVGLDLGANLVNVSSLTASGTGPSESLIYPGGNLNVELWITRDMFFDLDFQLGLTTVSGSGSSLNSNINGLRGMFGYHFYLEDSRLSPSAKIRLGFSRRQFKIDTSSNPNSLIDTTYAGMLFGGTVDFPVSERLTLGLDINTLIFNSVSESPTSSGEVLGSSNFDLSLRAVYRFNSVVDVTAKLQLAQNSAEFDGTGNRPLAAVSSRQTMNSLFLGLNYYF